MRKILVLFLLSTVSFAQNVSIIKYEKITSVSEGVFYYPSFLNESTIAFSSPNYSGIWIKEGDNKLQNLNTYYGSGYDYAFNPIDNMLLFRKNEYINGKKFSTLIKQNILTGEEENIVERSREISILKNQNLTYLDGENIHSVSENLAKNSNQIFIQANSEGIHLYTSSQEKILKPFGDGNYIWASLSPEQNRIIFNYPSKGTFVCDLDGNILFNVGMKANYPSWSRDGQWILFMRDIDNGREIISSDIFIKKFLEDKEINLTNSESTIELFPSYSKFNDEILFNSIEGEIYKLTLKFE